MGIIFPSWDELKAFREGYYWDDWDECYRKFHEPDKRFIKKNIKGDEK